MIRREAKDFITVHVTAPYGSENGRLDKLLDFRACNFVAILRLHGLVLKFALMFTF